MLDDLSHRGMPGLAIDGNGVAAGRSASPPMESPAGSRLSTQTGWEYHIMASFPRPRSAPQGQVAGPAGRASALVSVVEPKSTSAPPVRWRRRKRSGDAKRPREGQETRRITNGWRRENVHPQGQEGGEEQRTRSCTNRPARTRPRRLGLRLAWLNRQSRQVATPAKTTCSWGEETQAIRAHCGSHP